MSKRLINVHTIEDFVDKYLDSIKDSESIFPVDSPQKGVVKNDDKEKLDDLNDINDLLEGLDLFSDGWGC